MDLEKVIEEAFQAVMGVTPKSSDSLQTIEKWDSLSHVQLMLDLEDRLKVTIPDWLAVEMTDLVKIKEVLTGALASRGNT